MIIKADITKLKMQILKICNEFFPCIIKMQDKRFIKFDKELEEKIERFFESIVPDLCDFKDRGGSRGKYSA